MIGDPGMVIRHHAPSLMNINEHTTDALYTTMTTGMGAREQPIIIHRRL
nr:hypothetical protein [Klebsiella pneumoniae]